MKLSPFPEKTTMAAVNALLAQLFNNAETKGDQPALLVKQEGQFRSISWGKIARDVLAMAATLRNEDVVPGDRVAQVSENRYSWLLVDFALQMLRAVHVPLHITLSSQQIASLLKHCDARFLIVSGKAQAEKFSNQTLNLPPELNFLSHDPCNVSIAAEPVRTLKLADVMTIDKSKLGSAEDLATILYTSGTLGEPQGVALTASNFVANAQSILAAFGANLNELRLNFLPFSHIFARTCDLYVWVFEGSQMALAESPETAVGDCGLVAPTMLNGVPYFFDKVYRGLCKLGLAEKIGSLKKMLGGNIRMCISGGAAIPESLLAVFEQQGIPLLQGYGLTEASPVVSACTLAANRLGTAGKPLPGVAVQIATDGEILVRGANIMAGYYRSPVATASAIKDRWLHTGDIGVLDHDGYLRILGRKKEILVTAAGKNVAPNYVESLMLQNPLIAQVMVVGDGRKYLGALVVPNVELLCIDLALEPRLNCDAKQLLTSEKVKAIYRAAIDDCLKNAAEFEQVAKFILLPRPFSVSLGELTPKLSLRREQISANFAPEINSLYQDMD